MLREVNEIVVLITEIQVVSIGVITIGIVISRTTVTGTIIIRAVVAWPITEDFSGDSGHTM